ncbi:MAG: DUF4395 family protein [Chloroflexi bacterium]|nr:DUF4395 family protein [Chloroflexota bacterium]
MATIATTRHRIEAQGYLGLNDQTVAGINYGLRFGPAVCLIGALTATLLASPRLFWILALVAAAGLFLPTPPLDWLYNVGVRHLFKAPPLPATSRPRRFACLLATLFLLAAAGGFEGGQPALGYLFGGLLTITPAILVSTGFCVPSFIYGLLFGKPTCPAERPVMFASRLLSTHVNQKENRS